jgi:LytR cell envelope-related transcriptional attenuator
MTVETPTGSGPSGRGGPRQSSGINSAVRGAGLVGLAVIIGIVLLQVIDKGPTGNDGGASTAATPQSTTATTAPAATQPPTTAAPGGPKARGEVRVIVFNAGAASGAAGNMTNKLKGLGYQTSNPGNTNARRGTAVQCKQGFDKEATQLQGDVGAGTTVEPYASDALPETQNVNCVVLLGQ